MCIEKWMLISFLGIFEIFICVIIPNDLLIKWSVMTMLWLGERCSSMSMIRAYVFDALKGEQIKVLLSCMHWLLNGLKCSACKFGALTSIWWCYDCCEVLYGSLKSLLW